jgi:dihydrofolate reductase
MGKIVVTEFVSLDGVMEDPGGDGNFKHKGWTFKFNRGEAGDKFKVDETRDSEALLLGRVTYEGFAAAWPSRDGEFADKFNSMPKYVVSSTLEKADWNNSTVLKGDVLQEVSKLKHSLDGNIVVHGSAQLVQTLLANDLVEELRLMVFPVVLGSGKRLFGATSDSKRMQLVESKTVGDGIAILIYKPSSEAQQA